MTEGRDDAGQPGTSQALERSEQRFRLLVDSVVDYAIFLLNPDGTVATWNAGAKRLKGYAEDEIIGQHYAIFYPPESRAARLPERLLSEAREHGHVEHAGWRVRKDGTRFWADIVITSLYEGGQLTGYAKVTRDHTEAHRMEEAREQALAEKQRTLLRLEEVDHWQRSFIGSVVHDLQTPVTAITAFTEMLLEDDLDAEEQQESLERILSNARSLQELINNLRTYTRLEAGRVQLRRERIDLRDFVRRLLADMAPTFGDRNLDVGVEDLTVTADPQGLERILRNLLSNAARHTPSRASLHIRARHDDGRVIVEVEDEGAGVPAELIPRLFERFQSGTTGGTGLGLSIAKEYVDLHGGEIGVDSQPDRGAIFWFALPQLEAHAG